jgi:bacillithiol biosynthesis cysteine-adding enzyme BshC
MQRFQFHRSTTGLFNEQQNRLVYDQESLLPFLKHGFSIENVERMAHKRSEVDRGLLVDALRSQYHGIATHSMVDRNLELLSDKKTFTITTGHQLSAFTGPLYFVIKILHTIKLCDTLNSSNPDFHFVPVYWMASEDHDFEEIRSLNLFNRSISWNSEQTGPVGRFDLDKGFEALKSEFAGLFDEGHVEIKRIVDAYNGEDFAHASRQLVNELFGKYGLLIIDGDDSNLKKAFSVIVKRELEERFAYREVEKMNALLIREGVTPQVKARDVNLFYIKKGIRKGIEWNDGRFRIEGLGEFDLSEMLQLLQDEPEAFSPNVVLRPVYQEFILPNLTYVGGTGELSYWLQLKGVFDVAGIDFPLIQIRASILWIERSMAKRIAKLDIQLEQLFQSSQDLKKWYLEVNEGELLQSERLMNALQAFKVEMSDFVLQADPGLQAFVAAEHSKLDKQVEGVVSKVKRSAKAKHDQAMSSIELLKERLFPGGGLQERNVNFFQFCADGNVTERMDLLYQMINPLEKDLIVLRES